MSAKTKETDTKPTEKEEKPTTEASPPPPPEKAPTPEELDEARDKFHSVFFGGIPRPKLEVDTRPLAPPPEPEKTEKPPEETPPTETPPAPSGEKEPEEPEPPKESKPAAKAKKSAKPQTSRLAEPITDDVLERAAEAGARRAVEEIKPQPSTEDEKTLDLTDEDRDTLGVLREMERLNPQSYQGITEKTARFWKQEQAYAQQWQSANPGKVFNPEDDEHRDWYEKHEPAYRERDFKTAEREIIIREAEERAVRKAAPKIQQMEQENALRAAAPLAARAAAVATIEFVDQASPELAKHMEVDGKKIITPDVLTRMEEEDPAALDVLNEYGEKVKVAVMELDKMVRLGDKYPPNPQLTVRLAGPDGPGEVFYPHAELLQHASNLEAQIKKLPPEETARDGKTFVTTEEYNRMAETIMRSRRSNDEKRLALENLGDRYWILVGEDIRRSYVADMAARARKRIEYINGVFEKRMKKKGGSPTPATEKKSDAEESPKPVAAAKSKPPSSATPSDKQNPVESGKIVMDEQRQQIQRAMFG